MTDAYGYYTFLLPDGVYTVIVHVTISVIPGRHDFVVDGADVFVDPFDAEPHRVAGRLVGTDAPLASIPVSVVSLSVVTDDNGSFSFDVTDGSYRIFFHVGDDMFPNGKDVVVDGGDVDLGDVGINTISWMYEAWDNFAFTPALSPDGTVYAVLDQHRAHDVRAFDPDGGLLHSFVIDHSLVDPPLRGDGGTLYISAWTSFFAQDPGLTLKWLVDVPEAGSSPPVIARDGTLYFGCSGYVYAVNPGGSIAWKHRVKHGGHVANSPAVAADGTVYFSSTDRHV